MRGDALPKRRMTLDEVRLAVTWAIDNDTTWLMQQIPYEIAEVILDEQRKLRAQEGGQAT